VGEDCAAGREINGLLGGGGLCCWTGILVVRGPCCSAGEWWTAMWGRAMLLGGRQQVEGEVNLWLLCLKNRAVDSWMM
jgi:hypothetical protein